MLTHFIWDTILEVSEAVGNNFINIGNIQKYFTETYIDICRVKVNQSGVYLHSCLQLIGEYNEHQQAW